jgi:mycothiol synthase
VVREPHPSESGAIAALLNAEAEARHGEGDVTAATIEEWFGYDEVDLRVVEEGGALVAYGDIGRSADETKAWFDVREHPEHPGAAELLWPVLEDLAGEGVIHRAIVGAGDESLRGQLARRGYRPIRSSYRMLIELDGDVEPPPLPEGIEVRTLGEGEERRAYEAYTASFADHWEFQPDPYERWRRYAVESSAFDPTLWFLAEAGDEVAGVAICQLHDSGDPRHGWIGILGVLPAYRRRGLGGALLRHVFAEFARRGCTRVSLGVDAESTTGAVRLYERAGMRQIRRSDTWERRP